MPGQGARKQPTDSTHVLGPIRDLNRLEPAGERVCAAPEAISAAAQGWVKQVLEVSGQALLAPGSCPSGL